MSRARAEGLLRLRVSTAAESFLNSPVLGDFLADHPQIQLELAVSGSIPDIVAGGYDAGIELGEIIDLDMMASCHRPDAARGGGLAGVLRRPI